MNQSGEFAGAFNRTTGELFIHHWDAAKGVGKKCIWSNAFTLSSKERGESKYIIPGYDLYGAIYASCDIFNRNLHDRSFPHRAGGGKDGYGDLSQYWNFIRSAILQNTFNIYHELRNLLDTSLSYRDLCRELSVHLYKYGRSF